MPDLSVPSTSIPPRKFGWRWGFSVLSSLVLSWVIVSRLGLSEIFQAILHAKLELYLIGMLMAILFLIIKAKRWQYLLGLQGIHCSLGAAFVVYNIGTVYGLVTPGRLGDFMRVYHLTRRGYRAEAAFWGAASDRILDIFVLLGLSGVSLLILGPKIIQVIKLPLLAESLAGSIWPLTIVIIPVPGLFLLLWLRRKLPSPTWLVRLQGMLKRVAFSLSSFWRIWLEGGIGQWLTVIGYSLAVWSILIITYAFFAHSLSIDMPVPIFVASVVLSMFASALPISMSGLGVRDLSLAFLLSQFSGVTATSAVGLSWLIFSTYLLSAVIGVVALLLDQ